MRRKTIVADLWLKYYRAPRYRMRCLTILLGGRALVAQINDLHFWKTTYIYKDFTELHVRDVLYVQNCVRVARARTEPRMS